MREWHITFHSGGSSRVQKAKLKIGSLRPAANIHLSSVVEGPARKFVAEDTSAGAMWTCLALRFYSPEFSIGAESSLSWFAVASGASLPVWHETLSKFHSGCAWIAYPCRISIRWGGLPNILPTVQFHCAWQSYHLRFWSLHYVHWFWTPDLGTYVTTAIGLNQRRHCFTRPRVQKDR
jgi:hypothetical protein